ncbi:MAG: hypothetical protein CL792_00015 [Chloroflexi bacterium]|nr:hypothetical protein [Chloroflexota bacterium]|tara:strand:+ start:2892 stop:3194 length:303 start_codon:yes stop_codon:yes gene_type:complete
MTWDYIFMLALGAYAFKSGGLIILNKFNLDRFFQNSVLLIPIALLAALITEQTFVIDQAIDLDERVIGLLIALVLIKKKLPFLIIILCPVVTVALLRQMI